MRGPGPAGEHGRCSWCGWTLPHHDPSCYVPAEVARLAANRPPSPPVTEPPSRQLFANAQKSGATVGHEWARSAAQVTRQGTNGTTDGHSVA